MKKIFAIININILIFVVLILLMEGGSRLIFTQNDINPIFNDQSLRTKDRPFVEKHKSRGFALKNGFKNNIYSVNSVGFRGEDFPRNMDEKYVILTLGESTTFGWGVNDKQTYPYYLNSYFKDEKVYVINGGVPSYTSSQVLVYLKEIINDRKLKPNLILINILWNDIWYSSIKNWHPDILIYQKPPIWLSFLTKHSKLVHTLVMGAGNEQLTDVFNDKAMMEYGKNIEDMVNICEENDIKLAFIQAPFDADHMPDEGVNEFHIHYTKAFFIDTARQYIEKMEAITKNYKIKVIEHGLDINELDQKSLFLDTLHPTAQGNSLMAGYIYKQLVTITGYK